MCMFMTVCGTRCISIFGNTALDIYIYVCVCIYVYVERKVRTTMLVWNHCIIGMYVFTSNYLYSEICIHCL